jgi:flagellar hook-length control protein FliK
MPSTATTNVTIGTILDLLGPAPSSASSEGDQSAFESILSVVQPHASSPNAPTSNPTDNPNAFRDSKQDEVRRTPESSQRDHSDVHADQPDSSLSESRGSDSTIESDRKESVDSAEPSEEELAAQELVAQSLAGLPLPARSNDKAISATDASDGATFSNDAELHDDLAVTGLTTAQPASKSVPRSQPKANGVTLATAVDAGTPGEPATPESTQTAIENTPPETVNDSQSLTHSDQLGATESGNQQASETTPETTLPAASESQLEPTAEIAQTSFDGSGANERQSDTPQDESATADQEAAAKPNQSTDPALTPSITPDPTAITAPPVAAVNPNQSQISQHANANLSPEVAGVSLRSRLPAQALASAGDTAKTRGPVEIDTARLMTRVVRAFSAAQERDGEVRLRLSPAELGSLQLEIRVENGALTAKLHTETDAARTAIIENLPALREKLAEQGIRIERFDVDLMQRQTGGMPDHSSGRQPESAETQPRVAPAPRNSTSNPSAPSVIAPTIANAAGGLNVIV